MKKKVLFLIDGLGSGGAQKQLILIANSLNERGYKIYIKFYTNEFFFLNFLNNDIIYKKYKNKFSFFLSVLKFKLTTKVTTISFLDFPNLINFITGFLGKSILSERNGNPSRYKNFNIRTISARLSNNLVVNSYNTKNFLKNKKLNVIHNIYLSDNSNKSILFNYNKKFKIIILASISTIKQPFEFYRSLYKIKNKIQGDFEIDWYGDKKNERYFHQLRSYIKIHPLDFFKFHKAEYDIEKLIKNYGVGILISKYEGSSNSVLDYISNNLLLGGIHGIGLEDYANPNFLFNDFSKKSLLTFFKNIKGLSQINYNNIIKDQNKKLIIHDKNKITDEWEKLID
tara:strand:+ start:16885 stop:17907 length:1023 start_codon:yes stop_codon:yes gene_type:complete